MVTRVRYEILEPSQGGTTWRLVTRATVSNGWLDYSIRTKDGTEVGLARPGTWRAREIKPHRQKGDTT